MLDIWNIISGLEFIMLRFGVLTFVLTENHVALYYLYYFKN